VTPSLQSKAAKVAEGQGCVMFSEEEEAAIDAYRSDTVAAIRALNTRDEPEVDPNAWAFKHGLEST